MTRNLLPAGLCLMAISLAACERPHGMKANGAICTSFNAAKTTPSVAPATADSAAPVD